jgi:very-short-patch-repair endonuclease
VEAFAQPSNCGGNFRRQVPVDKYIVDFLCEGAKVIVELDGGQHQQQAVYDEQRRTVLEAYGYTVLRYWNNEVLANVEGVLQEIEDAINNSGNTSVP